MWNYIKNILIALDQVLNTIFAGSCDETLSSRAWRSAVWSKGYEILAEVKEGKRAIPTVEELLTELPKLVIEYTE